MNRGERKEQTIFEPTRRNQQDYNNTMYEWPTL